MNRITSLILGLLLSLSAFGADTTITALPAGSALAGTEPMPADQAGATVKTTPSAIATYFNSVAGTLTNKTINGSSNTITNISLTSGITGTLGVVNGGTGSSTLGAQCVMIGNGTSPPITDADFKWDDALNIMSMGSVSVPATIMGAIGSSSTGAALIVQAGQGDVTNNGGQMTVQGGPGGATSGNGGALNLNGGTPIDGAGGGVNITARSGATTTATGRSGGAIAIQAGNGVLSSSGGALTISSGRSAASGGTGNGGGITITPGNGGGTSGNSGALTFNISTPIDGNAGNISFTGRNGATTTATARTGSSLVFTAGTGVSGGANGTFAFNTGGMILNSATGGDQGAGTINTTGYFLNGVSIKTILSGTSASLGGGALLAGACATNATTVTGATTAMSVSASPVTYPGDGAIWSAYVSAADTVTTRICAVVALTPTASAYNIRVLQ